METLPRFSHRLLLPISFTAKSLLRSPTLLSPLRPIPFLPSPQPGKPTSRFSYPVPASAATARRLHSSSTLLVRAGWMPRLRHSKQASPEIVQTGDPVLHEPAQYVDPAEISSDRIQNIIDDMVVAMRKGPGVGLAAPQIGIPLRIIVLEEKELYISYVTKQEAEEQDRRPFDLLVIVNPKLQKKGNKTALFFEGCLSVEGYRAAVERHLKVEVTGLDRNGLPIKIDASGWQARILQHECDHLDGHLYVDKMTPKTFRTTENLDLPLANGCPKLGVR